MNKEIREDAVRGEILKYCGLYPDYFNEDTEFVDEFTEREIDVSLAEIRTALYFLRGNGMVDIKTFKVGEDETLMARITEAGKEELQSWCNNE